MKKHEVVYTDGFIGKIKIVDDFLPKRLVLKKKKADARKKIKNPNSSGARGRR